MIKTNGKGEFVSTIFTVSNGHTELVVGSTLDLMKETGLNKADADAVLFGDCKVSDYELTNTTEVELAEMS